MQIKSYQDASDIEERYLHGLANSQAECWWAKPFDEYRICTNENCKTLFSIEEVLWDILNIRKSELRNSHFSCTQCNSETEEIYETQYFISEMKKYFLWEVSAVLIIDESDNIEGFWVLSKTTIKGVTEFEFNTRVWSYDQDQIIIDISKALYWVENAENEDIICFHQIYLSPLIRNSQLSYEALKSLFEINEERYKEIPLIWEPRYDNRFYPILRSIGWENLTHDKYWYVIQYLEKYGDMLEFLNTHDWYQSFLWNMIKYKRESKSILKEYPELWGKKSYRK